MSETKTKDKICVFVESPYSGDIDRNVRYLKLCKYDCWARGEMPCSTHDDMTQHPVKKDYYVSDYEKEWDVYTRDEAISGAQVLRKLCSKSVFYTDLGLSRGMKAGIEYCKANNLEYETRTLNFKNVLSLNAELLTEEFMEAIVKGKTYAHLLKGSDVIPKE